MGPARQIVTALKGRWHGTYGLASCPSHPDGRTPALKVSDDPRKADGVDVHCFAGCSWETVKGDLARGGLLKAWEPAKRQVHAVLKFPDEANANAHSHLSNDHHEAAKEIWQATEPIQDTLAATYLESRGLLPPWPIWLRYHGALRHSPTGLRFPTLVAGVTAGDGQFCAVHP